MRSSLSASITTASQRRHRRPVSVTPYCISVLSLSVLATIFSCYVFFLAPKISFSNDVNNAKSPLHTQRISRKGEDFWQLSLGQAVNATRAPNLGAAESKPAATTTTAESKTEKAFTKSSTSSSSSNTYRLAGLSCQNHGGPSDDLARELIYWHDIPSDARYQSPYFDASHEKFLTFESDGGGFNNIR
jgi:hypothetical protein